jgi:hypothetical protein
MDVLNHAMADFEEDWKMAIIKLFVRINILQFRW